MPRLKLASRAPGRAPSANRATQARGVTLIELMVAVAVVALLMSVALPSYRDSMRKSSRAEAQAWLMAAAGRQQQFLVDRRSFAATVAEIGIAPPAGVTAAYTVNLTLVDGPPPEFSLSAVPRGAQIGERCGSLAVDQAGRKSATVAGCW